MQYIVDVLLLALVVLIVVRSVNKGFIASLLDGCAVGFSALITYFLCSPVSDWIYKTLVRDFVRNRFSNFLENSSAGSANLTDKILSLINELPAGAVRLAESTGINLKTLAQGVPSISAKTTEDLINTVADKVAYNIMIVVIEAVVFIVLFILFAVIIKLISKLFGKKINDIPIVGGVNKSLGGVFGIVKAVLVLIIVCTLLFVIAGSSEDEPLIKAVNESKIYTVINGFNPLIGIVS